MVRSLQVRSLHTEVRSLHSKVSSLHQISYFASHSVLRSENSLKTALASLSKNLLSRKGTTNSQEEMTSDNSFEELTRLVKSLVVKVDTLDSDSQSRHVVLCVKLQQLEFKTANLSDEIHDLQQGLDLTNKEVETFKDTLRSKAGCHFGKKDSKT